MKVGLDEPLILLRELSVDDDVHGVWPRVRAKELFAGKVDVKDWSSGGPFAAGMASTAFIERSLSVRSALRAKELRRCI